PFLVMGNPRRARGKRFDVDQGRATHNVSPRNAWATSTLLAANRRGHTGFAGRKDNPSGGGPMASSPSRRNFIRRTAALTGGVIGATGAARAAPLPVPSTNREPGRIIDEAAYGMPSKFEGHVKRRRTDVLKNRQNLSDWSMTPLQHQPGIITPNGLVYERHHAGTPDIDPKAHRLVIHGLVKQPL